LTKTVLAELEKGNGFQEVIVSPGIEKILFASAEKDRSPIVRSFAAEWLQFFKRGYYDIGKPSTRGILKAGWSIDEQSNVNGKKISFVWAIEHTSKVTLYTYGKGKGGDFQLRARAFPKKQRLKISLNGSKIGEFDLSDNWETHKISVGPGILKNGANDIAFLCAKVRSPSEYGSKDNRRLAMAVDWIKLTVDN
jgi:hypothetical protein